MCKFSEIPPPQILNCDYAKEICSFLWLLVSEPVTLFYFKFWRKVSLFNMVQHLAFAHWSKIFKYSILSQITVLPGKLNVNVKDRFSHFCSWLYSIHRSHQGTASTAECAQWGRLSITSQSLSSSMKAAALFPSVRVPCPSRNSKEELNISMDFRNRIEQNPTSRCYLKRTTHFRWH